MNYFDNKVSVLLTNKVDEMKCKHETESSRKQWKTTYSIFCFNKTTFYEP